MHMTRHVRARCHQRGIKEQDLSLIAQHGTVTRRGIILTCKDIARAEPKERRVLSPLQGAFVATDGATMVTTYRSTREQRRRELGVC